ncbi:MAG: tungsten ABC transporter substrate-binding protein [Dehalococcoidia bacterium]|nr:tungsten ABC transporter substrate-binding protein [Dehalococcoidia bacterium]
MKLNRKKYFKIIGICLALLVIAASVPSAVGCAKSSEAAPLPPKQRLRVATTTSLYDTGLWGYLEPMFEEQYGVELDVIYAGTGKALEYGRRGDVDIITVHDQAQEQKFIAEGYGVKRVPFACNYFLMVGPPNDPAGIKGMSPEAAFKKLMETGSGSFVSRGDDSGTHAKEKSIWQKAGYEYEKVQSAGVWYIEAGTGMGPTLMMASEKQGYTLTDMGTYLAYKGKLELVPIVDKGDILLNFYSAIAVNPENVKGVKIDMANNLIVFLTSSEVQELIGEYGVGEYGMQLFIPCAGAEPTP